MKRTVWIWELIGYTFVGLFGTILHFLYDWLDKAIWIAPFSGVNESTWEHMKLIFWPMFIFALFQRIFFRDYEGFWCVKLRGILIAIGLIPLLFYGYNGIIGKSPDWINIAIFFISGAVAFIYEARMLKEEVKYKRPRLALATICLIGALFVLFTFMTPELGIFRDPLTGGYGI